MQAFYSLSRCPALQYQTGLSEKSKVTFRRSLTSLDMALLYGQFAGGEFRQGEQVTSLGVML